MGKRAKVIALAAMDVSLVNTMSREQVLKQHLDIYTR